MAHTVFICHSAKDKLVADAACAALEAHRIPCWIAPRDVLGGTEWGAEIVDAIAACHLVVLIFSGNANDSEPVRREIELALNEKKIVVPFRIENIQPSGALKYALLNRHWLDAITPPIEIGLNKLCSTVTRIIEREQPSAPMWQTRPVEAVVPPPPIAQTNLAFRSNEQLRKQLEELQRQVHDTGAGRQRETGKTPNAAEGQATSALAAEAARTRAAEGIGNREAVAAPDSNEALKTAPANRNAPRWSARPGSWLTGIALILLVIAGILVLKPDPALIRTLQGHNARVDSVTFSPDGKLLASGSNDNTIKLWNVATGQNIRNLESHTSDVYSIAFSPDGRMLAAGGMLWDVDTGQSIRALQSDFVAFSPDGRMLAAGSGKIINLWSVATGENIRTLQGHTNSVVSVAFSPDGQTIASGSDDSTVRLWNVASGKNINVLETRMDYVYAVAFSTDGQTIACGGVGGVDSHLELWNVATGENFRSMQGDRWAVHSVAFSPDGKLLASGGEDNTIKFWNVSTGENVRGLNGHAKLVRSVSFSADGHTLASGSDDGTIKLWNVSSY